MYHFSLIGSTEGFIHFTRQQKSYNTAYALALLLFSFVWYKRDWIGRSVSSLVN